MLQDQFSATVWPYLSLDTTFSPYHLAIVLTNDGAGSALIRSASMDLDGHTVAGWREVVNAIGHDLTRFKHGHATSDESSVDPSMAIRAGESHNLLVLDTSKIPMIAAARKHRVVIHLCYCSINDRCWTLDAVPGVADANLPKPVKECGETHSILAD